MNHFKLFSEALAGTVAYREYFEGQEAARLLRSGQRFYLPTGKENICIGSDLHGVFDSSSLPFNETCILTREHDSGRWAITACRQVENEKEIQCVSMVKEQAGWALFPLFKIVTDNGSNKEVGIVLGNTPMYRAVVSIQGRWEAKEYITDLCRVTTLVKMLSLVNVKAQRINPPSHRNAKRKSQGKLPLYSYHVLNVGGEVWDSEGADDGDGRGYRSHLRRGHIRRLENGSSTWVRPHFVHGSIPGFVDKDYNVRATA